MEPIVETLERLCQLTAVSKTVSNSKFCPYQESSPSSTVISLYNVEKVKFILISKIAC